MIVVFEGPRCSGKTTLALNLVTELKADKFPAELWKSERGKDPLSDMITTIYSDFEDQTKLWVIDRFHLSEYVNSKASKRGTSAYVAELDQQIWHIDRLLQGRDAIIVHLIVGLNTRRMRLKREGKGDPAGSLFMESLWAQAMLASRCDRVAVYNDHPADMRGARDILFDLIKARWNRRLG